MIATDLSKQQVLYADTRAIKQINFTGNFDRAAGLSFFIFEQAKENVLDFSQGILKVCQCVVQ